MKEIKAYIHNHRISNVIRALKEFGQCHANPDAGCRNITVIPVQSLLKAVDGQEQHYSIDLAEAIINESKLELICEDAQVDELVNIIERTAYTSQSVAGWIYVIDLVKAIPILGKV